MFMEVDVEVPSHYLITYIVAITEVVGVIQTED